MSTTPRHGPTGDTPVPWPVTPARRPRSPIPAIVVALLVIAGLFALASVLDDDEPAKAASADLTKPVTVHVSLTGGKKYVIEGGDPGTTADITAEVNGETTQFSADVPLTHKDTGTEGLDVEAMPGSWIYFSAQMRKAGAEIECSLSVNGVDFAHGSSSVDYGIVTCKGTVPVP